MQQPAPRDPIDAPRAEPGVTRPGKLRRTAIEYGGAAGLSVLLAVWLLRLGEANLRVPFDYGGDATFFEMVVKAVVENGWYLTNPHLGAPYVLELHDFPIFEAFHLGVIKGMALWSHDWAWLFNLYFLLGFPLIAVSALAVFRHFRVGYAPALAGALLYAFAPRRLFTGETHYFLDIFWQVPLGVLVALWVSGESPPLIQGSGDGRRSRLSLRGDGGRSLAALAICGVTAATGIYYAVFIGFLIFFAGIVASLDRRAWRHALAGVILTGTILAVLAAQGLPTAVYHWRHGPNPQVGARQPQESEIFGLRISRLLLPIDMHRVPALRRLKERSDRASGVPPGESSSIGLGAVGSLGFLGLLGVAILGRRRARPRAALLHSLAVLNLLAVLLATTGGFGYLLALIVTPEIRGYSRMSVIIAFLSIFAAVILIERLCGRRKRLAWAVAAVVTGVGLFDQVAPGAVRPYAAVQAASDRDEAFAKGIEATVPRGAMIFDLPYQRFPESGLVPGLRMGDYDHLRLYLHSRTLRWSYPAIYNRAGDAWISNVSQRSPAELVEALSATGFAGIVLDRYGYADRGEEVEAALGAKLGAVPATSSDGRLAFFNLVAYNAKASATLSPSALDQRRRSALEIVSLRWMEGFFGPERGPNGTFHWCSGVCEVRLENPAEVPLEASIRMTLVAARPPASLDVAGDLFSERLTLPSGGSTFSRTVTIPPGQHVLRFHSDGAPAVAPLDPRQLVWFAQNAVVETLPPHSPRP